MAATATLAGALAGSALFYMRRFAGGSARVRRAALAFKLTLAAWLLSGAAALAYVLAVYGGAAAALAAYLALHIGPLRGAGRLHRLVPAGRPLRAAGQGPHPVERPGAPAGRRCKMTTRST